MGNERNMMTKWKTEDGIQYSIVQNPLSAPLNAPAGAEKLEQIHTDSGTQIEGVKIFSNGRKSLRYTSESLKSRFGIVKNADYRGNQTEIARQATALNHTMHIRHSLDRDIKSIKDQVAKGVEKYGGVLIVEQVHMAINPDPITGVRETKLKGGHCADGAKDIEQVMRKNKAEPASIGTQRGKRTPSRMSSNSGKFPNPPMISPPPYGMVEDQILIWAEPDK